MCLNKMRFMNLMEQISERLYLEDGIINHHIMLFSLLPSH